MKKMLACAVFSGLLVGLNGIAGANLITNGSFEDTNHVYPGGSFVTIDATSSVTIPGWTVASGTVDWIESYWRPSEGTKSIDLAGYYTHGLLLGTAFNTTRGQTYRVQFDMAGNPDQSYSKALVAVSTGDDPSNANALHTFTFDQAGHTKTDMGWQTRYFDFVATSTTAQLYFGDITGQIVDGRVDLGLDPNEAWGAALDNVIVDPVPEPSTFLLLGVGLAGVAALRRKSRR